MSSSKIAILHDRAAMLAKARSFFSSRNVNEVDCPSLSAAASVDAHIDLIPAQCGEREIRYLHSSPEYGMKRLLSQNIGDIYQLSHVFRYGEVGARHQPEFMMAEWYRIGMTFEAMVEETADFIRLFLGSIPLNSITYREAFIQYAGIDYVTSNPRQLLDYLHLKNIPVYSQVDTNDKDDLLNLILGSLIEPKLGKDSLCALTHYPASQAALAKTIQRGDERAAERFEIYYRGIELANGYHELADAQEQRKRLEEANQLRLKLGKQTLPIDNNFIESLKKGLPDCCGVAVGFDRLMMLRHEVSSIDHILPFSWLDS